MRLQGLNRLGLPTLSGPTIPRDMGVWAQGPLPSSHRISIYSHKPGLQPKATGVICPKRPPWWKLLRGKNGHCLCDKNETLLCGSRGEPLGAELACALARCPPGTNGRMLGREDSCFVFEGLGEDLRMRALVRLGWPPALESRDLDAAILFKAHMIETLHVREGFFFFF